MSHHVFVHLSEPERAALRQGEAHARHLAERNRFRVVLLSDKGHTVEQIAQELDLCLSTVRAALRRWRQGAVAGLRERPRSGRPSKVPP